MAKSAVLQKELERTTYFPDHIKLTPEVLIRLNDLFELLPPNELRDHLIELYHNYIMHEHDSLPYNFSELAESLPLFLDFLKFADEERKSQHSETEVTAGEE